MATTKEKILINRKVFAIADLQKWIFWIFWISLYISLLADLNQGNLPIIGVITYSVFLYAVMRLSSLLEFSNIFIVGLLLIPIVFITMFSIKLMDLNEYYTEFLTEMLVYKDVVNVLMAINFLQIMYLHFKAMRTLNEYGVRTRFLGGVKKNDLIEFARR